MKKKTMDEKLDKISAGGENEEEVMDWDAARKLLDQKIEEYKNMIGTRVNPIFALTLLHRLGARMSQGERTPELYDEIMRLK